MSNMKERAEALAGETIVSGTKAAIKKDIQENWRTYAKIAFGTIGAVAGVKLLFRMIDRPPTTRTEVHFYIHMA